MHTLLPRKERHKCVISHAHISSLGRVLIYTEDKQARSKVSSTPSCVNLLSDVCACVSRVDPGQEEVISYGMGLLDTYSRKFCTCAYLATHDVLYS